MKWTDVLPNDNRIQTTPDGYWLNGHIALKGEPPAQLSKLKDFRSEERSETISSIIPFDHFKIPALILDESNDLVILRRCDSDINIRMQALHYQVFRACIEDRYVFLVHDERSIILCANLKNGILGVAMPYILNEKNS